MLLYNKEVENFFKDVVECTPEVSISSGMALGAEDAKKFVAELADEIAEHKPKLNFEILIANEDDDEFEHEGYYNSVDEAIEALMRYKEG